MLLKVDCIDTYYGQSQALHGVSFGVQEGEILALLGRNGAGKSTTLRSIMGFSPIAKGAVVFDGKDISRLQPYNIARLGITTVPETRDPFNLLTVDENILLGYRKGSPYPLERLLEMFPIIREFRSKKGAELSGGQQQLMAMARGLAMGPRVLLLDEPSQGLAPIMVKAVAEALSVLKKDRLTVILVEQNLRMALEVADRAVVLEDGAAVDQLTAAEALADTARLEKHLTVH